ncbi:hypothetical protein NIES4072_16400 [Nostoc commune NIES-4072]|uniref:Uncharacterized protein n=1 Tax=Nostoc commune NIES-4072 TaxID=2005467 RepID=A0A2R5FKK5_NOSCO|nr:hypothetical protein NIES4070_10410 [Nostoc commune HK-02]GBG17978.1 hypothetical protein NIES4072_16400 [Nostoc commune NIES-4072]
MNDGHRGRVLVFTLGLFIKKMKTPVIKIQLDIKRLAGQALTKGL